MKTFGRIIQENKGHTAGFDYLRLLLALGIVCLHSQAICGDISGTDAPQGWVALVIFFLLPPFFALSGFLVAASLLRCRSVWEFLGLRILRMFPALFVTICLTALVLGPLLTTYPLTLYFSDHDFRTYFKNCLGLIHYTLPGLFAGNPIAGAVNGSLWTLTYEFECYLCLFVLGALGIMKKPALRLVLCAGFLLAIQIYKSIQAPAGDAVIHGRQLMLFFLAGVTLFLWRDKLPHHPLLLLISFLICLGFFGSSRFIYLTLLPLAYITGYFGLLSPKKLPVLFSGDYSYSIYLYSFPVQQTAYQLLPLARSGLVNFIFTLMIVSFFAVFSWHCIEKPTLRLKKHLKRGDKPVADDIPVPVLQESAI